LTSIRQGFFYAHHRKLACKGMGIKKGIGLRSRTGFLVVYPKMLAALGSWNNPILVTFLKFLHKKRHWTAQQDRIFGRILKIVSGFRIMK